MSNTENTIVAPAVSTEELDELDAQRIAVQKEMELKRRELQQQWNPVNEQGVPINQGQFPRSAIMRFLCDSKVTKLVTTVVAWKFSRRYPGLALWKK
jgi:hypothetical protein